MGDAPLVHGPSHPVVSVSWRQAAEFCNVLSARADLEPVYGDPTGPVPTVAPERAGYRLLLEDEWAYCAITGAGGVHPPDGNGGAELRPVDHDAPDGLGLHGLVGNVWEWCSDVYHVGYPSPQVDGAAAPPRNAARVLRGGSFKSRSHLLAPTLRFRLGPGLSQPDIGFRIGRTVDGAREGTTMGGDR